MIAMFETVDETGTFEAVGGSEMYRNQFKIANMNGEIVEVNE